MGLFKGIAAAGRAFAAEANMGAVLDISPRKVSSFITNEVKAVAKGVTTIVEDFNTGRALAKNDPDVKEALDNVAKVVAQKAEAMKRAKREAKSGYTPEEIQVAYEIVDAIQKK